MAQQGRNFEDERVSMIHIEDISCTLLKNKKILLCVSGGIAVYKSLELLRRIQKLGGEVKVVMSEDAKKFVTPLSFEALSQNIVLHSQSESWANPTISHISYGTYPDALVIAPATTNTIAKIAQGITDNILISTILASNAPKILAPSANTNMITAPQATQNIAKLKELGYEIVPPIESTLACGIRGVGALANIEDILYSLVRRLYIDDFWAQRDVLITGGGSIEDIDAVRFISNHSSGIQASALALALYFLGANVRFVTSKIPIFLPSDMKVVNAKSNQDFLDKSLEILEDFSQDGYFFGVGAMADYKPKHKAEGKLKKQNLGDEFSLELIKNIDILQNISKVKKVGFKAELDSQNALQNATKMLEDKNCDFVCLNFCPFGSNQNEVTLISKDSNISIPSAPKLDIALQIAKILKDAK